MSARRRARVTDLPVRRVERIPEAAVDETAWPATLPPIGQPVDVAERARRQERLQLAEATFDPLPFDAAAARAYGRVYAAVAAAGRRASGSRALDLTIAAVALAHGLPLYTSNPEDFRFLDRLVDVVAVPKP